MKALRKFFNEKWLELIISGICLPFLGAAIAVWLGSRPAILAVLAVLIVLLLAGFLAFKEWRERRKPRQLVAEGALNIPRRGVIFTMGFGSAGPQCVASTVFNQLKPEFVGFLSTPQIDKKDLVENLVEDFNLSENRFRKESWDLEDLLDGKNKTSQIIDWMMNKGLSGRDIVLDLTAGPSNMSIATFMAAEEKRIDCQYIFSGYDSNGLIDLSVPKKALLITSYSPPNGNSS